MQVVQTSLLGYPRTMRFVALLAAALALATAAAAHRTGPVLRLAARAPVVVHGAGFRAGEQVRVHVQTASVVSARSATASAAGAFTVRFAAVALDRCSAASVWAVGGHGDGARLKVPPPAMCPVP